jgi:5-methylcytosine-specific restriction endonuclease McrA
MKEVNYGRNINYNSNTNSGFNLLNFNNNNNTSSNDNLSERQNSGLFKNKKSTKRSVSETKKKYIAYLQDWKCGQCGNRLKHTFEVDHKIRLEQGGGNDVSNLVALCRECHGCKTAMENM